MNLVSNSNLMKDVGKKSREYFEKYYSKKANEKKLLNIFNELR